MAKESSERFKTYAHVFDEFTNDNLYKLIRQHGLQGLLGQINMGKEASIFIAMNKDDEPVIVKIYSIQTVDFLKMWEYISNDPRYPAVKNNRRKVIFAWAQREYRNLLKAREAMVAVPTPIAQRFNIIIMEFVGVVDGDTYYPARMLKDAPPKDPERFFSLIIDDMRKLYRAGIVHADLSAFNILNHDERPVFIDMSQATLQKSPHAEEFLVRDVRNMCSHFAKLRLKKDPDEVISRIKA